MVTRDWGVVVGEVFTHAKVAKGAKEWWLGPAVAAPTQVGVETHTRGLVTRDWLMVGAMK